MINVETFPLDDLPYKYEKDEHGTNIDSNS